MSSNMFLDFNAGSIVGESEDADHPKWVEVKSFTHGFEQPTNQARSQSGGTLEKCKHNPIEFTRKMDTASVQMLNACWAGKIWPKIIFNAYRAAEAGPVKYLDIVMENAIVASYSVSGSEGDIPDETISINYGKVTYSYAQLKKDDLAKGESKVHSHNLITNAIG